MSRRQILSARGLFLTICTTTHRNFLTEKLDAGSQLSSPTATKLKKSKSAGSVSGSRISRVKVSSLGMQEWDTLTIFYLARINL